MGQFFIRQLKDSISRTLRERPIPSGFSNFVATLKDSVFSEFV
jgi:hypothetical protein